MKQSLKRPFRVAVAAVLLVPTLVILGLVLDKIFS